MIKNTATVKVLIVPCEYTKKTNPQFDFLRTNHTVFAYVIGGGENNVDGFELRGW